VSACGPEQFVQPHLSCADRSRLRAVKQVRGNRRVWDRVPTVERPDHHRMTNDEVCVATRLQRKAFGDAGPFAELDVVLRSWLCDRDEIEATPDRFGRPGRQRLIELAKASHRCWVAPNRARFASATKDAAPFVRARLVQSGDIGADLATFGIGQPRGTTAAQ